jgi:hypothetical protein
LNEEETATMPVALKTYVDCLPVADDFQRRVLTIAALMVTII